MQTEAEIVIVGAGMVGSTLALALHQHGLQPLVVDGAATQAQPFAPQAAFEPRVSALSATSQRVFERLGVWAGMAGRRVSPYTDMRVWDGSGTGRLHFSAASVQADVLGHIVENRVVQDALLDGLNAARVPLVGHARLAQLRHSGDDWLLSLSNGQQVRTPLVVAADGAHSAVRQLAGCATREWDYLHHAIVTSVRTAGDHCRTAWQRFTDDGPLAFLPLLRDGKQDWCSIVWSVTPAWAKQLMALDTPGFCQALGGAFEHRLGQVLDADPRLCVPLRQRHAKRYVQPGLALIGDAAHTLHPLAGQGVNLGLLDAAVLAEELLHGHRRGERLADERVLGRYERRRMPHNLALMAAMEGFERLFQAEPLGWRWLRNTGLKCVEKLPDAKAMFVRQALGQAADLPQWLR
ncbi:2-octaprenyl-3-methyl-6-methoxy-1,4-benzoquinol hydroxylase [Pseudomonas typographi]|uniref:2-octaprenyl-3-methyl-6-methoxy-1,4-benzoquinol hydroxylase n=1 Tax=Pseudomonas typographi TaxID=2715964 RepID=A0ABR7Z3C9_9PSED|nr:2-octaprenyl-3-methyl-6-methoxy-1,4-benzoquinol hydroxylase [Pseudomonas typographi]MBD1586094.1 2-octaprenyl-3-methyl-6-methoxy-1,4-benzoquinol hydroxylase [Pseudomonas typographi]MBD1599952.1 2-octaprenyl-3-methyl-6-methoxy-1,4-benzoquinol hydroxylase [Pseudomonas typographi]